MTKVYRIAGKTVTGYANVAEALKGGNAPFFDSAESLAGAPGVSVDMLNKMIHVLTGKPDTKPYDTIATASKAAWPLIVKAGKPKPKSKPETKEKGKVAPKKAAVKKGPSGQRSMIMTPTAKAAKENPYRAGSKSGDAFAMVIKDPGKTFQHYVDKGARVNTLAHAIREGHVKLTNPK